ncbi:MAG: hypothetical protein ABR564_06570 [Candidatus Dormibacteria bacterium]
MRDYSQLTTGQQRAFLAALRLFRAGLRTRQFDPTLRVKLQRTQVGVWELTWAPDGRATFHYGPELTPGEPHIVWRRIGSRSIFRKP